METSVETENNAENLQQKKELVTGQLQKRYDERVADVEKRKIEKKNAASANERIDFFEEAFNRAIKGVEDGLSSCSDVGKAQLADHFDELSVSLQKAQKFLSDSTFFLNSHRVEKSQEAINKLTNDVQAKRDVLIPKKKFAFKSKKKDAAKPKPTKDDVDSKSSKAADVKLADIGFTDKEGETLSKAAEEIQSGDVTLARLTDCTVKLYGSPSTLHMSNLRRCTILGGPVSSSVFVDNCRDCTFVLPCQQLRVHTTTASTFYLHVTCRAIIEDCNSLLFAPYNLSYDGLEDHYRVAGLDKMRNTWDDVDDFNWLASDAHSPNWAVLEESQRRQQWTM